MTSVDSVDFGYGRLVNLIINSVDQFTLLPYMWNN